MARRHIPEEDLFRHLDDWEANQPNTPTLWDVVRQDDGRIAVAYIARTFRKAAQDAVLSRERVTEVRRLALLAFKGDAAATERYLRAQSLLSGRTPLEATVESINGMDEAVRGLALDLQEHALALMERIASSWSLSSEELATLLGADPNSDKLDIWRSQARRIPLEVVVRATSILFTQKAVASLLGTNEAASEWLRTSQSPPPFRGNTPLDVMSTEGTYGIRTVRNYLEQEAAARMTPQHDLI